MPIVSPRYRADDIRPYEKISICYVGANCVRPP